jgi:hypothetical protein
MTTANHRARKVIFFLLVILLPVLLAGLASAQEPAAVLERLMQESGSAGQESFYVPAQAEEDVCSNLILNSQLDVVDTGGGNFTAVPWEVRNPILYYAAASDPLAYDGTSFILKDGDPGDATPREDMFIQTLQMPYGLKSITVEYQRNTINGNPDDIVWGELWLVNRNGKYVEDVAFWNVFESNGWAMEALGAPPGVISRLSGRRAALVFFNDTDGSSPSAPEAEKEWMLFDNIILNVCYDSEAVIGMVYTPIISRP